MEILGGLSMMGGILSQKSRTPDIADSILRVNKDNKPRKYKNYAPEKRISNIYSDDNRQRVRHIMNDRARKKIQESKKPQKTGVIPKFYNKRTKSKKVSFEEEMSDSEFSESFDGSVGSVENKINKINTEDPIAFIKAQDNFTNTLAHEKKFMKEISQDQNTFLKQFDEMRFDNPSTPTAMNGVPNVSGNDSSIKRAEMERTLALHEGFSNFDSNNDMTYHVVDKTDFVHNNMKPYFKGKSLGYDVSHESKLNSIKQRTLEQFSGSSDNLEYRPKSERKPLFDPTVGYTNIYGLPVMLDYYDSRYIPSDQRRNEKPFQEVRVTPGVGLGYNQVGTQGYHDPYRVLPKTVDELRTVNKPKLSYKGVTNHGMKGERGPIAQKVFRRRPLTYKEYKKEDILPSLGYLRAPTVFGNVDPTNLSTVNRGIVGTEYYGIAGKDIDLAVPESMKEKVRDASRENYRQADPRNVERLEGKEARGFTESFDPKITQRDQKQTYIGPAKLVKTEKSYAYNQEDNTPDPTMRDIHSKTDRAGHMGNNEIGKSYVIDLVNGIPDPTMRDIHSRTDRTGQIGNTELDKSYIYDYVTNIQDPTMRDIHSRTERTGQLGNTELDKSYAFDYVTNIQDPTMRDVHSRTERTGQIGNTELDKSYIFDYVTNVQDPTMRDVHSRTERTGQMGNKELDKTYAFDYVTNIQDPTMRDVHARTDRAGQIGNNELSKSFAFDYVTNIQDPTMRDVHSRTDRAGQMGNKELNKSFAFDYVTNIQDPTMRDIHSRTDRAGQMGNKELDKKFAFDYINNIQDPTMRDIHGRTDRAGNMGNKEVDKTFAFDYLNNVPDFTMRDIHNKNRPGGAIGHEQEKQRSRGDANNERVNITKEVVAKGRMPTLSNYDKGPTPELTLFRFCEPIQIVRDLYPDNQGEVTSTKLGTVYTRDRDSLPQQGWHFYSYVDDNLKHNPYVNNVVHQASSY